MYLVKNKDKTMQRGAVSLFIVIFTALLVTTITISFMQLMVKDQKQAMNSDLSESAYDSAVAGVEDAKRALLMQQDCIGQSSQKCSDIRTAMDSGECTTLSTIFGSGAPSGEMTIMQSEGDRRLEQAYTCVKVIQDTTDYVGSIDSSTSATLVPLRGKSAFNKIIISWGLSRSGGTVALTTGSRELPEVDASTWPESRPALLRTQLINGGNVFKLSNFDATGFSNTLFMYPSTTGTQNSEFALDGRRGAIGGEPQLIACDSVVSSGAYACSVSIDINPSVVAGSQTAFLNLMALYNRTDFKIELRDGDTPVLFSGVQPEVDSTGRANDLFRRVVSRVELNNTFNYPVAELESRNNICKYFSVTTEPNDYDTFNQQCDPEENS